MEWIDVNDRLPEYFERVLVNYIPYSSTMYVHAVSTRVRTKYISTMTRTDTNGFNLIGKVTHWMPLPEPPKQ